MNRKPSLPPSKMPDVGTTIFTEMTALAQAHGALNVAQGFPDLPTPEALRQAAADAMEDGHNQYAPMPGNKALRTWIAEVHHAGAGYCPDTEITVGAGASSVLYAAMTALLQPGDEVVMQEPGYDLYAPVAELNFAKVVRVPLDDDQALHQAVGARTRIVVLNSPHNPTGNVLTSAQLDLLADALEGTDAWVLSDEVYGPMVHDGRKAPVPWRHPKLRDRTLVAGSFGKLFHATGWKIGWMAAPAELTRELRKVHQYDVFSTGAPFQEALARYLVTEDAKIHLRELGPIYQAKRDRLLQGLEGTAFTWQPAEGGYFQVLNVASHLLPGETDRDLAVRWTKDHGIATIPMGAFGQVAPSVRVCFAKEDRTIDEAVAKLRAIPTTSAAAAVPSKSSPSSNSPTQDTLRVVALQADLHWQDPEANRTSFAAKLDEVLQDEAADLVLLPEMFTTGFSMDTGKAEPLDAEGQGVTRKWMQSVAQQHGVALGGTVAVRDSEGEAWNRFWLATPEGDVHAYDKRHLFHLAGEGEHYQAGTERVEVTWRGWRLLLQTCYDLRFPGFVRNHGSEPYDAVLYLANWPAPRSAAWRTLLQARAIENQCFVAGVNRSGTDGSGHHYAGDSLLVDMAGNILADAGGAGSPVVLRATWHKSELTAFRTSLPFLQDADRFGIR